MRLIGMAMLAALTAAPTGCDTPNVGESPPVAQGRDLVSRDVSPLTAAEVRAFLQNSTLVHKGSERIWYVYLREDGSLSGRSEIIDSGGIEDSFGTWEVFEDGRICRQWSGDWAGGGRGCAAVFRYGDEYLFVNADPGDGEEREIRRTRLPGNPKRL
jgi:hypothetical protein